MNKLLIDTENNIEIINNALELDIQISNLTINIKGKVLIQEICKKDTEDLELTINVEPNSSVIYNRFIIHENANNKIKLIQNNNSSIIFNYSFIANDKIKLDIESKLTGDNNNTEINVKTVTENNGSANITSTADVIANIKDNKLSESIKILLLNNEESVCVPNLLVSSNEVEVNHAAAISNIDKDYLFYLNSKGLSNKSAIKIIKNGYLLSNLDINDKMKEQISALIGGE